MPRFGTLIQLLVLATAADVAPRNVALAQADSPHEIGRTTERELKIVLTSSFGSLMISRGEPEKVLVLESSPASVSDVNVDYAIRNRIGYLDIALGEGSRDNEGRKGSFKISRFEGGKWHLKVSDAVPISFDVQLGVGRGDFDLSGLQVKDFNLSTGASDVTLSFDEPNRSTIDDINIESGVSKFDGRNLCNANFKRFRFQGGVGAYTLDFGGPLNSEVDVDLEVGFGVMTMYLPPSIGARVIYEKNWVSTLDCPNDFEENGDTEFVSENYYSASGKMNIRLDSGMGTVRIRRH